ncbi:predicted protein [Lichtheimia corymbifera JMRC:FSU:9682]|uniref:Uncharacterized protein n=1 Tax=Lichtheimia corymbifera JMRC:FSU:9682 TaxID=1263082 RepID=A0A068S738_9FUNG|nr:predicted protein [Lichtheimia corymbifera JMRC:FSU:9682]
MLSYDNVMTEYSESDYDVDVLMIKDFRDKKDAVQLTILMVELLARTCINNQAQQHSSRMGVVVGDDNDDREDDADDDNVDA